MKKFCLLFVTLAFAFVLGACSEEPVPPTPDPVEATEISIVPIDGVIEVGATHQMKCNVTPEDADVRLLVWNSTNTKVATISKEGVLTAVSRGKATITARLGDLKTSYDIVVWNAADAVIESKFLDIRYWGDYYNAGTDNFTVAFGTVEHAGMVILSPGEYFQFSMNTAPFKNIKNAYLLPGVYTFDSEATYAEGTITGGTESRKILYSADSNGDGAMEESVNYFQDAYMDIEYREDEGVCVATIEVKLDTGKVLRINYRGIVEYTNTLEYLIPKQITEDVDVVCTAGSARHRGVGKYSIDLMENATDWCDIEVITLTLFTEASDTKIKAGTYPIQSTPSDGYYMLSGWYEVSSGMASNWGSYSYKLSSTDYSMVYTFFDKGTLTISYEGDEEEVMKIDLNAIDLNGHKFHATYSGAPILK